MRSIALASFFSGAVATLIACSHGGSSPNTPPASAPDAGDAAPALPPPALADDTPGTGPEPAHWRATGSLVLARMNHTATLLASGKVLVVGGETFARKMLSSVEEYDPATDAFTHVADLPEARSNHTATLLSSGKVLIAGGGPANDVGLPNGGSGVLASAVVYDPDTHAVTPTGSLNGPREFHHAFALTDGRVLVVGGADASSVPASLLGGQEQGQLGAALATTETYDPTTETWSPGAAMQVARFAFAAARMADGRLLVTGGVAEKSGSFTSTEVFDPAANAWSKAGDEAQDRLFLALARLGDGTLLAIGGKRADIAFLATTERFDPPSGHWSAAAPLPEPTTTPTLTTLSSGNVLRVAGLTCTAASGCAALGDASIFDAPSGSWRAFDSLKTPRAGHTTTVLSNGDVLVVGGYGNDGQELASAERSSP